MFTIVGNGSAVTPLNISILRDGSPVQNYTSVFEYSFAESGLTDGLYEYTITATSVSGKSASISRKVRVDSTQPVISVTSATTLFNAPTQEFSGTVSESGSGLNVLEYSQDNLNWTQITPVGDVWTINLSDAVEGAREIYVRATDEAGNSNIITIPYTNSFTGSVSVAVTIVNPAEPSLTFTPGTGTLSIPYSSTGDVTIEAPAGYTGYSWKLNGTVLAQTTNVCTINLSTGEAKDLYIMGTNTLSLIINNNGEYYSGSYTFTVTN